MLSAQNGLIALVMVVGTLGIVVPVLPGLPLVWAGALLWALIERSGPGWLVLAVATTLYAAGLALEYLLPGRRLRSAGVGSRTILLALLVAAVGFFVVPVIGAPIGFVVTIYAVERVRLRTSARAWTATKHALHAVVLNIGIELATALAIMTTWLVGVYLSA